MRLSSWSPLITGSAFRPGPADVAVSPMRTRTRWGWCRSSSRQPHQDTRCRRHQGSQDDRCAANSWLTHLGIDLPWSVDGQSLSGGTQIARSPLIGSKPEPEGKLSRSMTRTAVWRAAISTMFEFAVWDKDSGVLDPYSMGGYDSIDWDERLAKWSSGTSGLTARSRRGMALRSCSSRIRGISSRVSYMATSAATVDDEHSTSQLP